MSKVYVVSGNEPFRIDEFVRTLIGDSLLEHRATFGDEEKTFLSQISLIPKTLVISSLSKEDAKRMDHYLMYENKCGRLIYITSTNSKRYENREDIEVTELNKYNIRELEEEIAFCLDACEVKYEKEDVFALIERSEYSTEDSISFYDLNTFISTLSKSTLGPAIPSFKQSSKNNAFDLFQLKGEALKNYYERLDMDSYQLIGALLYSLRVMFKGKYSNDLNISSFQIKKAQTELSRSEILDKMKSLSEIKMLRESDLVMKSLIYSVLV